MPEQECVLPKKPMERGHGMALHQCSMPMCHPRSSLFYSLTSEVMPHFGVKTQDVEQDAG